MNIDVVAREIVKDLFTNGAGNRADRLVMVLDNPRVDLGGWSESGAVARIKKILAAHVGKDAAK